MAMPLLRRCRASYRSGREQNERTGEALPGRPLSRGLSVRLAGPESLPARMDTESAMTSSIPQTAPLANYSVLACAVRLTIAGLLLTLAVAPAPGSAQGPPEPVWQERVEIASGGGFRGRWRMNESVWVFVDDPTVAIDDRGFVAVAWADQYEQDIYFRLFGPDGVPADGEQVNVSRTPGTFSWLPRMLLGGENGREVSILWQEIIFYPESSHGGDILFARSVDGGRTFSAPINLSNTAAGAGKGRLSPEYWHNGSLDLAAGPDGTLYAAWTEYEGALWLSRSSDGGERFSEPLRIGGSAEKPARGPALAVGDDGVVYLAWTVGEVPAADIHFARSSDGGRSFTEPSVVHASEGHADAPKVVIDRQGVLHLVYAESPTGPLQQYHIRYTRSLDGGATFEEPRVLAREPNGNHTAHFPHLDVDRHGRIYVLWDLFPDPRPRPLGLGFTYSDDGGRSFAAPSVVPGSDNPALGISGSQQGLLMRKLAVNEAGAIAAVNSTFQADTASHVWLFRARTAPR
jgi:hypothetical protein